MNPEDLTTHALGEPLPPAGRAALEQALQSNPQTRADFEATQAFTGLLQQHLAADQPEAALTAEQKQRLVAQASPPVCVAGVPSATDSSAAPAVRGASRQPAQKGGDRAGRPTSLRWLRRAILPLSAAALIMVGMQQWQEENRTVPEMLRSESAAEQLRRAVGDAANRVLLRQKSAAAQPEADQKPEEAPAEGTDRRQLVAEVEKQLLAGKSNIELGNYDAAREAYKDVLSKDPYNSAARRGMEAAEQKRTDHLTASNDHTRARMLNEVNVAWEDTVPVVPIAPAAVAPSLRQDVSPGTIGYDSSLAAATPAPPATAKPALVAGESAANTDGGAFGGGYSGNGVPLMGDIPVLGGTFKSDDAPDARRAETAPPPAASAAAPAQEVGLKITAADPFSAVPADSSALLQRPAFPPQIPSRAEAAKASATESYTPIQENPLTAVVREPLSTFSIDVDTAAYANVRRFLNRSSLPPRDAVRIEELVNYFPYNLEGPAPDSPHPFAVHVEIADCPWQPQHRLARIGVQGKRVGLEERNSNLVFLVDVSGSMNQPDKLPLVKESLRLLVEQLDEKDRVAIVTYAGSSGLVLPPTGGDQKERIHAAINSMTPGGSTHGSAGIQLAYEQAIAGFIPEGVNRVILCTDGDFNVGVSSPEELEKLITEKARSGVFLSVLGYGTGNLKDRTMETLADKGNGNYAYIDSLSEARKTLVEQMTGTLITIAKDVKIQVEFNPAQVAAYRLIGYENRLLAKEDFNDDTKDAGEIGAGHSVTALYEIVPAGVTPPPGPVDPLKYQPVPAAAAAPPPDAPAEQPAANELLTVKLRYKAPDGDTSQLIEVPVTDDEKTPLARASAEFKFTAAAAAYGLMLRQSSYRGALTWEQIRNLAIEGKGADPHGYRAEFIQLLDKARGLQPANP